MTCPSCGRENAADARFCSACGTALAASEPERKERKVVTVLFADLVGSTSRAENADPEDVDARLRSYHGHVRAELERFGGTVEKFIGDAVVALFGAPVAHEDDPERAVRAALAIRDWAREEGDLQVRVAVNTGEALVTLGVRPAEGEGMAAGDVLNTAARLQSAAPVNGVLVSEQTYRATERAVEYRPLEPVEAKGKAQPVAVWEAVAVLSRLGVDVSQESRAALVGREREREILLGGLERVRAEREPQLVTLIGVPGIGKSRLVYELLAAADADEDLVYWRQGRSLPYGEGVAFWAFAEMVKAQAGILETDSAEVAREKLAHAALDLCGDDGPRVERTLRPLVGLSAGEGGHESREESFAAWRRFVEGMADRRPTVLVFEDLHWADNGLLDFIDHLVDWSSGVPLLCVCTARPELLERRPDWGGGKLNATTIALSPLSDNETQQLLANLLGRTVLPAELLQFAGGNPLYAEEYARMLADRGLEETALPETVQGIIAARLDALPGEEKAVLQNAAVLGKVFWSGSLTALDGEPDTPLQQPLHALTRKEFVRRERRSSVGGQEEYAFRHVLVQDVAYGQIPRAQRAVKHRRAAEWIESVSERGDDLADLLAHHYVSALEFGADGLGTRAARALREAGDRSFELNSYSTAVRYFRAGLDLLVPDDPVRGEALVALGRALFNAEATGNEELREGARLLESRNPEMAADALILLALLMKRDQQETFTLFEDALALVRDRPATKEKGSVLSAFASQLLLAHEPARAMELAREALEIAMELGDLESQSDTLLAIGNLRLVAGDRDGLHDMERALELAFESNSVTTTQRCYGNLADACASHFADIERCFALQAEGRKLVEKVGAGPLRHFFAGERVTELYFRGRWDEAFAIGETLVDELSSSENPHFIEIPSRDILARIALGRGSMERAAAESATALAQARLAGDLQVLYTAFAGRALVLLEGGQSEEARGVIEEYIAHVTAVTERTGQGYIPWIERTILPWLCRTFGYQSDLALLLDHPPEWRHTTPWATLIRRVLEGDDAGAADTAEQLSLLPDAAFLRLKGGVDVERALAFYRQVGATRYVAEAEKVLAA